MISHATASVIYHAWLAYTGQRSASTGGYDNIADLQDALNEFAGALRRDLGMSGGRGVGCQ